MDYYSLIRPLAFQFSAETAHDLSIRALAAGIVPSQPLIQKLTAIGTLTAVNPVGMAAGFDKNGAVVSALFKQGFGFVECGTVTPRPQPGNPKPRLFRLKEDRAVINRFGFNNEGLEGLKRNLARQELAITHARSRGQKLGINIGKNKDSEDVVADYLTMLEGVAGLADYVTINISSPNTPGLRDLQAGEALENLLSALCDKRAQLNSTVPLWLKLAPDLSDAECEVTATTIQKYPIDALIISNTTLARPETLQSSDKAEAGGLSGAPLMALSTDRLRLFKQLLEDHLPLIGVGGIASAADAQAKLDAGATAVQVYSALVYQGFGLAPQIARSINT